MTLVRMVWGGAIYDAITAGTQIEEWSCSLSLDWNPDELDQSDLITGAESLAPALSDFHTNTYTGISARVSLDWLKLNQFNPTTGHQVTDPTVIHAFSPGIRGDIQTNPVPLITTCRVSLDDQTRNARHRGGFFIPVFQNQPDQNGRYSSTLMNGLLDAATDFMTEIKGVTNVLDVVIWSRADGALHDVNRVRIGNVPDFQSRRKNNLQETYVSATF